MMRTLKYVFIVTLLISTSLSAADNANTTTTTSTPAANSAPAWVAAPSQPATSPPAQSATTPPTSSSQHTVGSSNSSTHDGSTGNHTGTGEYHHHHDTSSHTNDPNVSTYSCDIYGDCGYNIIVSAYPPPAITGGIVTYPAGHVYQDANGQWLTCESQFVIDTRINRSTCMDNPPPRAEPTPADAQTAIVVTPPTPEHALPSDSSAHLRSDSDMLR